MVSLLLGLLAGALTTLSPCVLPVLPFIVFAALDRSRLGPLAIAAGMAATFTAVGVLVTGSGWILDGSGAVIRGAAAGLMLLFGAILLSPALQQGLSGAVAPIANRLQDRFQRLSPAGLAGQFALGALLGAVWTPCSGPTLGAAVGLAATSGTVAAAASIMLAFSLGASLPLLAVAYGSRQMLKTRREALHSLARHAKPVLGFFMIAIGAAVLTGVDKTVETALVDAMPDWLVGLTTRY